MADRPAPTTNPSCTESVNHARWRPSKSQASTRESETAEEANQSDIAIN